MATAKQRAWRAKFARIYGGKSKKRSRKRGGNMVRYRKRMGRRRGFGSIGSFAIPILAGAAAPMVTSRLGVSLPMRAESAGAGYLTNRSLKGAILGWVGGQFLSEYISGFGSGQAKPANSYYL